MANSLSFLVEKMDCWDAWSTKNSIVSILGNLNTLKGLMRIKLKFEKMISEQKSFPSLKPNFD